MKEKIEILKILADSTRLKVLGILAKEDCYIEKIASSLGITPATVCYHLKRMEKAGIVRCSRSQFYILYSLNKEMFNMTLGEFIMPREADEEERYKRAVLNSFFKLGKLVSVPVQQKKREIVLLEIAKAFDIDKEYKEADVNSIIKGYNDDYCTIRRELIAFKIFERVNGSYKRIR